MRSFAHALAFASALSMAGCVSDSPPPQAFAPTPGQASITITRSGDLLYLALPADVVVSNETVAHLMPGQTYTGVVAPGAVKIVAFNGTFPGRYALTFVARTDKSYRFIVSPRSESYLPVAVAGYIGAGIDAAVNENAGGFKIELAQ